MDYFKPLVLAHIRLQGLREITDILSQKANLRIWNRKASQPEATFDNMSNRLRLDKHGEVWTYFAIFAYVIGLHIHLLQKQIRCCQTNCIKVHWSVRKLFYRTSLNTRTSHSENVSNNFVVLKNIYNLCPVQVCEISRFSENRWSSNWYLCNMGVYRQIWTKFALWVLVQILIINSIQFVCF